MHKNTFVLMYVVLLAGSLCPAPGFGQESRQGRFQALGRSLDGIGKAMEASSSGSGLTPFDGIKDADQMGVQATPVSARPGKPATSGTAGKRGDDRSPAFKDEDQQPGAARKGRPHRHGPVKAGPERPYPFKDADQQGVGAYPGRTPAGSSGDAYPFKDADQQGYGTSKEPQAGEPKPQPATPGTSSGCKDEDQMGGGPAPVQPPAGKGQDL